MDEALNWFAQHAPAPVFLVAYLVFLLIAVVLAPFARVRDRAR